MKRALYVLLGAASGLLLLMAAQAFGQTIIAVEYDKASLKWDAPLVCDASGNPTGCGGDPMMYHVKCAVRQGAALPVVDVPAPATTVTVKSVVPGPGKYECFVTAENQFGESGGSNVLPFDAGNPPVNPTGLGLIVQ